jgi:hypothetical protein
MVFLPRSLQLAVSAAVSRGLLDRVNGNCSNSRSLQPEGSSEVMPTPRFEALLLNEVVSAAVKDAGTGAAAPCCRCCHHTAGDCC